MSIFNRFMPLSLCLAGGLSIGSGYAHTPDQPVAPLTCGIEWLFSPLALPNADALTVIEADQLIQLNAFEVQLVGRAQLSEPGLIIIADQLDYHSQDQTLDVLGDIEIHREDVLLTGDKAFYDQANQNAEVFQLGYQLKPSGYHGRAEQLRYDGQQNVASLQNASYTTCSLEKPAWQLNFNQLEINQNTRRLYGHHGFLSVKGVPILYTPYINFPLDDRATGFLFPTIGRHRSAAQTESETLVGIPFYWAIAHNYDATFNLLFMEQRGLLLDTEWRYLQPDHQGELNLGFIQDQQIKSNGLRYLNAQGNPTEQPADATRWRASFQGQQHWTDHLHSQLNWHEVSDPDFYNDMPLNFQQNHELAAQQYRVRQAALRYQQAGFQAHIQHYGYLPLRNGEGMVLEKSPELGLNWSQAWQNWQATIYAETTEFKRYSGFNAFSDAGYVRALALDNSLTTNPTRHQGQRQVLQPSLRYRIDRPYGFAQAETRANYRRYQLSNAPDSASTDNLVMQYAARAGLIFERDLTWGHQDLIQTLEPQIQWLYVPYKDQSHLSLFDSGMNSIDFTNLFQLNRFSGFDRIGDTEQISFALTNRLLNQQGQTLAEASVGQIVYLRDRQVGLFAQQLDQQNRSDYFVRLGIHLSQFDFNSTHQFNQQDLKLTQSLNRLKWQAFDRIELLAVHQGLNLDKPASRQQTIATGLMLKLTPEWQVASYVNLDLETDTHREFMAGLRYDSCCWASELSLIETQLADSQYDYSIKYVIEFKGLSSVGQRLREQIQRTLNF
jgi:LPS-assembly protein